MKRETNKGLFVANIILWISVVVEVSLLILTITVGPTIFDNISNRGKRQDGSDTPDTPLAVYTITWKNDDGTVLEVDHDVKPTDIPSYDGATPTKASEGLTYYTFNGWDKELAPVNEDTTFFATYTTAHHDAKVVFDLNGEGENLDPVEVVYGERVNKPTDPATYGLTFEGWYLEPNCVTEWNFESDTVTSDMTLYAKWDPILYTVTFDLANSHATQTIESQTVPYRGLITKPEDPDDIFVSYYSGYVFRYWKDSSGHAWDFKHDIVQGDMTLYAVWEEWK